MPTIRLFLSILAIVSLSACSVTQVKGKIGGVDVEAKDANAKSNSGQVDNANHYLRPESCWPTTGALNGLISDMKLELIAEKTRDRAAQKCPESQQVVLFRQQEPSGISTQHAVRENTQQAV